VVTVYEKSLKISKAVIKVPTQFFVVTVYEKRLKISKAVIKVPTHLTLLINSQSKLWGNLDNALDIFKLFSYTVTTNYLGTLITPKRNQGSPTVCFDCL
jgi:hypothetical protein